ncbi:hypothetical protein F4677DRAFT_443743 [Hypoxylon crocopeplum]|nr:hypothetical protein F4677DRAFT_443743 [Hypoxylon crocopeplum]
MSISNANIDQHNTNGHLSHVTRQSSKKPGHDIKDHLFHYLGCIDICDRNDFFTDNNPLWQEEVAHQKKLGHNDETAQKLVQEKRKSWEDDCIDALKRIGFLRYTVSGDNDDKHLVDNMTASLEAWRHSPGHGARIEKIKKWRKIQREKDGKGTGSVPKDQEIRRDKYDPEKDVTVPIIQLNDGKPVEEEEGIRVWNKFPNQKTKLAKLLNDTDSLLRPRDPSGDRQVRYFHLPSNNMDWVERAIARYFGEDRPDYQATHRELQRGKKTKAYMILQEQYWRGQLHGVQPHNPAHARHLRPLCEVVSSDPKNTEYFPRNMVLFMPYLHWDTSRKNEQFTMEIEDVMRVAKEEILKREKSEKMTRQNERCDITEKPRMVPRSTPLPVKHRRYKARIVTMNKLLNEMRERKLIKTHQLEVDGRGRVKVDNPLGQVFLDAARLYEGMSNYRDKKLLRNYLCKDPPLHPRRTLDQAYHWTLNSTGERDRDQVVYRGTTTKPEDFHKYICKDGEWIWKEHDDFEIHGQCGECKMNIQKLSRVIMVDQLWMWILDAKTIITCFPKRYGTNKQDASAVHKSIRVRIQDSGPDQIRTVFDLALIIIDECTNTFFDRTTTVDRQPQVMDVFSKAIGNIMHKQTVAFERLWRWTDEASDIYRSKGNGDTSELHVPLLDINPEGKLEREIKDIIEELDIMTHITKVHEKIITQFIANAEHILDPFGKFGDSQKRKMTGRYHLAKYREPPKHLAVYNGDDDDTKVEKKREDYDWFKINADERLESVVGRIDQLKELRISAVNTAESVKVLLDLKQQQASVVQAWQSIKQSEETIRQGRSIMMFTLVTIIFLPLSFMSSVFGMNNMEITDQTWSIQREFLYMFTISAAVTLVSLVLAFGTWVRAFLYFLWKPFMTAVMTWSGLYRLKLDINLPSKHLNHKANEISNRLKENIRKARLKRKLTKENEKNESSADETPETKPRRGNYGHSSGDQPASTPGNVPTIREDLANGNSVATQNGTGFKHAPRMEAGWRIIRSISFNFCTPS